MALNSPWPVVLQHIRRSHLRCLFVKQNNRYKDKPADVNHVQPRTASTTPGSSDAPVAVNKSTLSPAPTPKAITISKAMKAYIERVKAYDDMMKAEVADFEIGKRHLANIMGEDPDSFTQQDINRAISYLLPSGIFDKKARPILVDPYEVFPKRKAGQFGLDGRPFHWLYFTTRPNYYNLLYDITWKMEALKASEDELRSQNKWENEPKEKIVLLSSEWITRDNFSKILVEKIEDKEYIHFLTLMERLANHPLAPREEEFIMKFREAHIMQSLAIFKSEIKYDEDGRAYSEAPGKRKRAEAKVRVYKPGTGKFTMNDIFDISKFKNRLARETIMAPLSLTNLLGEVDIVAKVEPYGMPVAKAGAIRVALSKALTAFVDEDMKEQMRLAGLLTVDPRMKERKKPGQPAARKKFTWKRR